LAAQQCAVLLGHCDHNKKEYVMTRLISPNDLQDGAKEQMLGGKEPVSMRDWALCVNFWAINIERDHAEVVCSIMAKIFFCPLSEKDIKDIVKFQIRRT
jgi:hypothetical protein